MVIIQKKEARTTKKKIINVNRFAAKFYIEDITKIINKDYEEVVNDN